MRVFAVSLILLTTAAPLVACLWDRDTFAMEAKGRLEVVETAVGWFDRFPPEYYQMRLGRVVPEIAAHPDRLDLYDDAAVACDRLGRHADAVGWMDKKAAVLRVLPPEQTADHRYRMHANLGVFHIHLWLHSEGRAHHTALLEQAIQDVKTALEINPNAHFGRERAHLALLEWWKAGLNASEDGDGMAWSPSAGESFAGFSKLHPETDFVKGLCGLIQMGSAQESVDVHALLGMRLMPGQQSPENHYSLAYLTCLRIAELALDQQVAVHPAVMHDAEWKQFVSGLSAPANVRTDAVDKIAREVIKSVNFFEGPKYDASIIAKYFHEARVAAIGRQADKTAFMLAQFKQGRHPDTHADFWQGWQEPALPPIPPQSDEEKWGGLKIGGWIARHKVHVMTVIALGVMGLAVAVLRAVVRLCKRWKNAKR